MDPTRELEIEIDRRWTDMSLTPEELFEMPEDVDEPVWVSEVFRRFLISFNQLAVAIEKVIELLLCHHISSGV